MKNWCKIEHKIEYFVENYCKTSTFFFSIATLIKSDNTAHKIEQWRHSTYIGIFLEQINTLRFEGKMYCLHWKDSMLNHGNEVKTPPTEDKWTEITWHFLFKKYEHFLSFMNWNHMFNYRWWWWWMLVLNTLIFFMMSYTWKWRCISQEWNLTRFPKNAQKYSSLFLYTQNAYESALIVIAIHVDIDIRGFFHQNLLYCIQSAQNISAFGKKCISF